LDNPQENTHIQHSKKNIHKAELHNLIWYSLNEEGQILDFTLTETPCISIFRLLPHPKHAYVGSTNNLYRRFMYHRSDFSRGKKTCPLFYQAIREHGWQQFEFAILEHVLVEAQLLQREQYYLDTLLPHFNFNRRSEKTYDFLSMRKLIEEDMSIDCQTKLKPK
jgi:hypothetical protein